jgi:hypothetical protein
MECFPKTQETAKPRQATNSLESIGEFAASLGKPRFSDITVEITEPTVRVNQQNADDQTQIERIKPEMSKIVRSVNGIKAKSKCFDGFACIALLFDARSN